MSVSCGDFSTLTSRDGYTFIVESKLLPSKLSTNLPYDNEVVLIIVEYLHYKYMNQNVPIKQLPDFEFDPALALEVLKASIELGI